MSGYPSKRDLIEIAWACFVVAMSCMSLAVGFWLWYFMGILYAAAAVMSLLFVIFTTAMMVLVRLAKAKKNPQAPPSTL